VHGAISFPAGAGTVTGRALDPSQPVTPVTPLAAEAPEFRNALAGALDQVQQYQQQGDVMVNRLLAGEEGELHSTILAVQRAGLAFDLFLQVRGKVISAYQEIMRLQV
jgi:flagellar hook-basal body complex protein FliE